jgi:hypothetical protein
MKSIFTSLRSFLILFVLVSAFLFSFQPQLKQWGVDFNVVAIANILLLLLSIITFYMQHKAVQNSNPNVFIRSVMGGTLLKMMVSVIAAAVYIVANRENYSKGAILLSMGLYLVYLGLEVVIGTKMNRQKK